MSKPCKLCVNKWSFFLASVIYVCKFAQCKLILAESKPLNIVIGWHKSLLCLHFSGPKWHQSRDGAVLLASRRYNGSRSRKTKGSLADTLQCNIWRRAQTAHRMTHSLYGGGNHGQQNGFTALGKKIGTSKSTQKDSDYVTEHQVLKYLRNKIAHYLHDYRRHWFPRFGLPPPNGEHDHRPCQEAPDRLRFKFTLSLYLVYTFLH